MISRSMGTRLVSYYNDLFICYCSNLPRGHAAADANVDDEDQMAEESSPLGIVPHQVTIVKNTSSQVHICSTIT